MNAVALLNTDLSKEATEALLKAVRGWKWGPSTVAKYGSNPVPQTITWNGCEKAAPQSNQPLHPTTAGGLTAAVVAGERRR